LPLEDDGKQYQYNQTREFEVKYATDSRCSVRLFEDSSPNEGSPICIINEAPTALGKVANFIYDICKEIVDKIGITDIGKAQYFEQTPLDSFKEYNVSTSTIEREPHQSDIATREEQAEATRLLGMEKITTESMDGSRLNQDQQQILEGRLGAKVPQPFDYGESLPAFAARPELPKEMESLKVPPPTIPQGRILSKPVNEPEIES
jgi:hypothetical protein